EFGVLGGALQDKPVDFDLVLADPLAQLRFLSVLRNTARFEQLSLAGGNGRSFGIALHKSRREDDSGGIVALGFESRLSTRELDGRGNDSAEMGPRRGGVEPHHHVGGGAAVAVLDENRADTPAARMLDLFDIALDNDKALRNYVAGQPRGRRPSADGCSEQRDQTNAGREASSDLPNRRVVAIIGFRSRCHFKPHQAKCADKTSSDAGFGLCGSNDRRYRAWRRTQNLAQNLVPGTELQ